MKLQICAILFLVSFLTSCAVESGNVPKRKLNAKEKQQSTAQNVVKSELDELQETLSMVHRIQSSLARGLRDRKMDSSLETVPFGVFAPSESDSFEEGEDGPGTFEYRINNSAKIQLNNKSERAVQILMKGVLEDTGTRIYVRNASVSVLYLEPNHDIFRELKILYTKSTGSDLASETSWSVDLHQINELYRSEEELAKDDENYGKKLTGELIVKLSDDFSEIKANNFSILDGKTQVIFDELFVSMPKGETSKKDMSVKGRVLENQEEVGVFSITSLNEEGVHTTEFNVDVSF